LSGALFFFPTKHSITGHWNASVTRL